ncbi:MAG: M48 family metallopeptidase [Clostridia bacterium]|nr:M48 family metallopeptidase [Clostridia bacterium]
METIVIRSRRKTLSMQVKGDGQVEIWAPLRTSDAEIRRFLETHRRWLEKHLQKAQALQQAKAGVRKLTAAETAELKKKAKRILPERVAYWAPLIGVRPGRIAVRCQKTRWGSCSAKGNLNFNCLLMLAPDEVIDSIVVHELCHLKHMNHSKRFYAEIEKVLPDYRQHQQWLKDNGEFLLARVDQGDGSFGP